MLTREYTPVLRSKRQHKGGRRASFTKHADFFELSPQSPELQSASEETDLFILNLMTPVSEKTVSFARFHDKLRALVAGWKTRRVLRSLGWYIVRKRPQQRGGHQRSSHWLLQEFDQLYATGQWTAKLSICRVESLPLLPRQVQVLQVLGRPCNSW